MTSNKIMRGLFFTLISLTMPGGLWVHAQNKIPKIGIIGGGIGGTSCAYFLKSLFGESAVDVVIDIFEAEKVGGRLSVVDISEKYYEEGGSIIHSRNKYMVEFLKKFRLKKRKHEDGYFALYDGQEFVFSESKWQLLTLLKVLYRYGYGFWKLRSYIEDMLTKFERIYKLQDDGVTYNTVGSLLAAMDPKFVDYLQMSTKFGFERQGISKKVVDEIIMATTRTNYGQALNIHKMVGSVSVAGVVGSMWSVHGGNVKIPQHLLRASKANLINLAVTSVEKTPWGQFQIKAKRGSHHSVHLYDVVIIAAPQTFDSKYRIKFQGFDEEIKFLGRYHKTVCTILEGNLSAGFFPNKDPFIDEVLTTTEDASFNSIGRITPVDYTPRKDGKSNVWKIFTQEKMNDTQLGEMFSEIKKRHVTEWLAYPHYGHSLRNDSFVLAPNLYHINAIEWAASAMEMSVIGARNVALLASKRFLGDQKNETTFGNPRPETASEHPRHQTVTEYPPHETTPGYPRYETTPGYPRYETTPGYPHHETTPGYPRYETTPGYPHHETTDYPRHPRYETTPGYPHHETTDYPRHPRYETTLGYPHHETTDYPRHPRYETTPGYPHHETTDYPRHPRYETTPGYPRHENTDYPRYESTPGYPRYETTPGYPRYETPPGYPRRETTDYPRYPRYETTPGYPRHENTDYPRYESTPGYPLYETTPGYPRYETTPGYPRRESTEYPRYERPGYPRYESTPGYPRHEATNDYPRYESTTTRSGVRGEKEEL